MPVLRNFILRLVTMRFVYSSRRFSTPVAASSRRKISRAMEFQTISEKIVPGGKRIPGCRVFGQR